MPEFVTLDLEKMPPRESYSLLTGLVQPRPIAFVSTISASGVLNLAPFSFFMAGGSNPPSICYSPTLSSRGREKDSLRNARETREFVVNTVHRDMARGVNQASASLGPDESEWGISGFTPIPSEVVNPPRVAESLAQMECKLFKIVDHGEGPAAARYVIGEVVRLHTRAELWADGKINMSRALAVGRLGGTGYVDTAALELFEMARPD